MGFGPQAPQRRLIPRVDDPLVYYIRRGDHIKIGFTESLAGRMNALKPDALLALEPGGMALESQRHQQFKEDRDSSVPYPQPSEWYTPSPALLDHIKTVADGWLVPRLETLAQHVIQRPTYPLPLDVQESIRTGAHITDARLDLLTRRELCSIGLEVIDQLEADRRTFIDGLYQLNTFHGWTTTQLGDEVGMSFSQVSRLIRARKDELAAQKEA